MEFTTTPEAKMQTMTSSHAYVINFKIDGRSQQRIRFGTDIASVRDSARAAIKREWPTQKLSALSVRIGG